MNLNCTFWGFKWGAESALMNSNYLQLDLWVWQCKNVGPELLSRLHLSLVTKLELFTEILSSAWLDLSCSAESKRDHRPSTGSGHSREVFTWLLYMLTPQWHYAAGRCETSAGSRLTSTSWPPWRQSHEKRQAYAAKAKQRTETATNCREKRNQTEEVGENSSGAGTRGFDTPIQSQRSWANMAVGVVLLSGMLWQRFGFVGQGARAGTQGSQKSCRAITSSRLGRESLMPSHTHCC